MSYIMEMIFARNAVFVVFVLFESLLFEISLFMFTSDSLLYRLQCILPVSRTISGTTKSVGYDFFIAKAGFAMIFDIFLPYSMEYGES